MLWKSNYRQWIWNFCRIIITQFHNLANNFNRWMVTKKISVFATLLILLPYMPIIVVMVWLFPRLVRFWNYVLWCCTKIQIHCISFNFHRMHSFYSVAEMVCLLLAKCFCIERKWEVLCKDRSMSSTMRKDMQTLPLVGVPR